MQIVDMNLISIIYKLLLQINFNTYKKYIQEMLDTRMPEIARAFKIPLNNLGWVAAFHAKKNKPHCYLIVWNKNQDMTVKRKPFINYKKIRSTVAKSVFEEELKAIYEIKDITKSLIGKMSKNHGINLKNITE